MSNIYRIYPVLWKDSSCQENANVYAIDRETSNIPTRCSARIKEDPAYYWESGTFQRLLLPTPYNNSVTWHTLPAWLSYIQTLGYSLNIDLSKLKPHSDLYISGP